MEFVSIRIITDDVARLVAFYEQVTTGRSKGAFTLGWVADLPSPLEFLELFETGSADNVVGYSDASVDALIAQARAAPNPAAAAEPLAQAQRLVDEAVPAIPLFAERRAVLVSERTEGLVVHPLNYRLLEQVRLR